MTGPDPPQEVSAAVKDFSVVLKWKTPNSKNITSYRVTFYWNRNNMFTRFIRCQRHQNDKCKKANLKAIKKTVWIHFVVNLIFRHR